MRALLLALLFISNISLAADTASSVDDVMAEPIQSSNSIDEIKNLEVEKLKAEVDYLKAQNVILDKYLERLNNSYYAAISFAGAFLLLFLGFNFFSFKGQIKDEKDVLLTHINSQIKELENKLDNNFLNHSNNAKLEYQIFQNSLPAIVSGQISSELGSFELKMLLKQDERESNISKSISRVSDKEKDLQRSIGEIKSGLEVFKFSIKYDFYDLKVEHEKVSKTCDDNRLATYLCFIRFLKDKNGYNWKVSNCLDDILTLVNKGAKFSSGELPEVEETLKSLRNSHQVTVDKIINLL
ncbi:hypothetical protein [Shewanella xiamenensis]|uniref:hypothetical protein n=1 Tax=Shewanella xiamenensis TaxID=332186 RepID=UPI0035BB41D7